MAAWLTVIIVMFIAAIVEAVTEYFFGQFADHFEKLKPFKWLSIYVAAILGVIGAFVLRLDMISLLSQFLRQFDPEVTLIAVTPYGLLMTGLGIGRGSNFVHDLWSKYFVKPAA